MAHSQEDDDILAVTDVERGIAVLLHILIEYRTKLKVVRHFLPLKNLDYAFLDADSPVYVYLGPPFHKLGGPWDPSLRIVDPSLSWLR